MADQVFQHTAYEVQTPHSRRKIAAAPETHAPRRRPMRQLLSRLVFVVVSCVAFCGCSSHRQLAIQAVDFNLTLEKAQNEMMLLNVIRAKDRLPMYMTGIASLSGNVATSFSASVGGSYTGAKGRAIDTITRSGAPFAGAAISANPNFSLAVLDTQEFMKGFLDPVKTDVLAYYWHQGWPPALLMYLLVQRVEIAPSAGGRREVLLNYPDNADPELREAKAFGRWLQGFLASEPRPVNVSTWENVGGPKLSKESVSDVQKLIQVSKEGMRLCRVRDTKQPLYQLQRVREELRFALGPATSPVQGDPQSSDSDDTAVPCEKTVEASAPLEPVAGKIRVTLADSRIATMVLRSPDGLVYYLGELMRVANRQTSPKIAYFCIQKHMQPIFVALPAGRCKTTQVDADAGRGGFSVPQASEPGGACDEGSFRLEDAQGDKACEAGRSMQALRLLSQITSLQKSAKDMPSAAVVRLIN